MACACVTSLVTTLLIRYSGSVLSCGLSMSMRDQTFHCASRTRAEKWVLRHVFATCKKRNHATTYVCSCFKGLSHATTKPRGMKSIHRVKRTSTEMHMLVNSMSCAAVNKKKGIMISTSTSACTSTTKDQNLPRPPGSETPIASPSYALT